MRNLFRILFLLLGLTAVGTLWFWLVEDWSLVDSAYMTVITLTTVGFAEVHPLDQSGRLFVIVFLIAGLGVFMYAIVQLGELVVRAELRNWWRQRGMHSKLMSLHDHFIVCGLGRMGRAVCRHLAQRRLPFAAIDRDPAKTLEAEKEGWPVLCGDATSDDTLLEVGITRARGMAVVLAEDADNLFVVLSARMLAPDLKLIARALDEGAATKMEKAGADRVVSLFATGASTLAQLLVNPHVEEFFEVLTGAESSLDLAEIRVTDRSPCANQKLAETGFRQHGVIIVAIRPPDGEMLLPPPASTVIRPGDKLIAMGKAEAISTFLASEVGRS
ncbi:MAG: potassium channel protein [Planctomycetota bacterium]